MKTRLTPTFPRVTRATLRARRMFYDHRQCRWVIYRRAGGVEKRTSVRGGKREAEALAIILAARLHAWPGEYLAAFKFNRERCRNRRRFFL